MAGQPTLKIKKGLDALAGWLALVCLYGKLIINPI
jgi:hypothetical protein